MNALWLLAAANNPIEDLTGGKVPTKTPLFGPLLTDIILILGAIVLVTVILLYWAAYIRKPKRNGSSSGSKAYSAKVSSRTAEVEIVETPSGRRKWRRRRRDHRPRNPTLAETGGLPPPKSNKGQQLSD
jgi:uncharacterized membrane protein YbhN (UPF0104 family)